MSKELEIFDNKIIVLYILENSGIALTIDQIVKFCEEFEEITYFDICNYIEKLKKDSYIEEIMQDCTLLYSLTEKGKNTLKELLELIPGINLYNLKKIINRNMVHIKTNYEVNTIILPDIPGHYNVSCYIKDGNDELVNICMYVNSKEKAKLISKNWGMYAEEIYSKLLELINIKVLNIEKYYIVATEIISIKSNEYKVVCYIQNGKEKMANISLYAGNKEQAKTICDNWTTNAEEIYSKLNQLLLADYTNQIQ